MPRTSLDGEHWEPQLLAEHEPCGLIGSGPHKVVTQMVAIHFASRHGMVGGVLIEGEHFTLREAPLRCDFCAADIEPPYWEHTASQRLITDEWVDADGEWAVCETCHAIIGERALVPLVRRIWACRVERSPFLAQDPDALGDRAEIADFVRKVMPVLDSGRRVTIERP